MTNLFGKGVRITKNHLQVHVLGGLDEINSHLGVFVALAKSWQEVYRQGGKEDVSEELVKIVEKILRTQSDLLALGASVAKFRKIEQQVDNKKEAESVGMHPNNSNFQSVVTEQGRWIKRSQKLELLIDEMEESLPELKNFILPGGSILGANLHLARSVVRRVEREMVRFAHPPKKILGSRVLVEESMQGWLIYLNRLSDYLFVLARYVNMLSQTAEEVWHSDIKEE